MAHCNVVNGSVGPSKLRGPWPQRGGTFIHADQRYVTGPHSSPRHENSLGKILAKKLLTWGVLIWALLSVALLDSVLTVTFQPGSHVFHLPEPPNHY